MAALGSQTIASSYEQLLHVDTDGGGNGTTHVSVKDGDNGTTFGFTIASDALMMTGTNRLEFGDTGTYIHQSADGVLDLVSDTEIEINATTIDMNGAAELSGILTVGVVADAGTHHANCNDAIIINGANAGMYNPIVIQEDGNDRWRFNFEGSGATNSLSLTSNSTPDAGPPVINFLPGGNVGIGTASPSCELDVRGASGDTLVRIVGYEGNHAGLELWGDEGDDSNDGIQLLGAAGGDFSIRTSKTANLAGGHGWDTRLFIKSDGNVGIGDTSPDTALKVECSNNDNWVTRLVNTHAGGWGLKIEAGDSANEYALKIDDYDEANVLHWLKGDGTAYYKGKVGIGITAPENPLYVQNTTSISGDTQRYPLYVHNNVDDDDAWGIRVRGGNTGQTGNTEYLSCYNHNNTKVGMVHNDGGTFSLVDISDKRLKKNIRNTDINGIDTINSIKVRDFEYKINNNTVKAQFIAQEIQEVFPQASTGTDGALTEDGEIDPMGVTKEGLVGVLVKAVQELSAQNDALTARIEALESA
jgi:hypothetical protein